MNIYTYWFFWIYSIYKRFNESNSFYNFATAAFSVLVSLMLLGFIDIIDRVFINIDIVFDNVFISLGVYVVIYLLNNYMFILHKKHEKQYEYYLKHLNINKSIISLVFTLISIFMLFVITDAQTL